MQTATDPLRTFQGQSSNNHTPYSEYLRVSKGTLPRSTSSGSPRHPRGQSGLSQPRLAGKENSSPSETHSGPYRNDRDSHVTDTGPPSICPPPCSGSHVLIWAELPGLPASWWCFSRETQHPGSSGWPSRSGPDSTQQLFPCNPNCNRTGGEQYSRCP